jgi:hypothetical protein
MEEAEEEKCKSKQPRYKSLMIDNVKYRTLLHDQKVCEAQNAYEEFNPFKLTAFIPGTIIKHTREGRQKGKARRNPADSRSHENDE